MVEGREVGKVVARGRERSVSFEMASTEEVGKRATFRRDGWRARKLEVYQQNLSTNRKLNSCKTGYDSARLINLT